MTLFLIKIGKAWHVLKNDGLIRGGRRILNAGFALFRRVRAGDILFISGGVGDSARYRCQNIAEELRLQGFKASVTVSDNPFLLSYADQFSVFVFHRVLHTGRAKALFERLKELKKEIIFETDDLVYDPEFIIHTDYYRNMNVLARKLYQHGVGGEILADPFVKVATTTTSFLADKLRDHGKRVFIVPNKLSQHDIILAKRTWPRVVSREGSTIRIGYLAGTPSHDKDFSTITEALIRLFKRFPEIRLVLTGPIKIEDALLPFASQIQRVPFLPREKLFTHISTLDINLAPLESNNPFCESKSELKFFEAGVVGVPTVAVANQTFREAIEDGVDGYVASNTDAWVEKLEHLITDRHARILMGEMARQKVLTRYVTDTGWNTAYAEYLRSFVTPETSNRQK